jgi:hypothetical protein
MVLGLLPNADQERYSMLGEDLMVFGLLWIADQQRKCMQGIHMCVCIYRQFGTCSNS